VVVTLVRPSWAQSMDSVKKYRVAVLTERIERGKIYLTTDADNSEEAKERIEDYLLKAEYDLELSPGQFVSDGDQYPNYNIGHVIHAEEMKD
jgi:hypothetical protein